MTDIVTDMKHNIAAAGDVLMYDPPLKLAQARELVVIVESLREDKRSLTRIVDDLSTQVNALNQTLQGVVEASGESVQKMHTLESRAECFGCGSREVLATPYQDMAGRALFNLQCTVCGRQWQQFVDYVETLTAGEGTEVRE